MTLRWLLSALCLQFVRRRRCCKNHDIVYSLWFVQGACESIDKRPTYRATPFIQPRNPPSLMLLIAQTWTHFLPASMMCFFTEVLVQLNALWNIHVWYIFPPFSNHSFSFSFLIWSPPIPTHQQAHPRESESENMLPSRHVEPVDHICFKTLFVHGTVKGTFFLICPVPQTWAHRWPRSHILTHRWPRLARRFWVITKREYAILQLREHGQICSLVGFGHGWLLHLNSPSPDSCSDAHQKTYLRWEKMYSLGWRQINLSKFMVIWQEPFRGVFYHLKDDAISVWLRKWFCLYT